MATGRVANYGCPGPVEARVGRRCLEHVACCEADVLKGSRPATAGVADPPVFYIACDYSFSGEGGAEMPDVRQVISGLPETAMDDEKQRERSIALGKSKFSELVRVTAVANSHVEKRRGSI